MSNEEKQVIAKGSKSFYLASLFFSNEVRDASWKLYRWCRYCDDQVDTAASKEIAIQRLQELELLTDLALTNHDPTRTLPPEFLALQDICRRYQIPSKYPLDLLEGFRMDVEGRSFQTLQELETYGYHVAGVVGLMMTHIFGASSQAALSHAVNMGVAMQLTNISRDLMDDYALQRIYLPRQWLEEEGITESSFIQEAHQEKVLALAHRLLNRADELYSSGYQGLRYLPFHAALAVSMAGSIYSHIGRKVRRKRTLQGRAIVSLPEKWLLALYATVRVIPLLIVRRIKPWKAHSSLEIWSDARPRLENS